MVLCCMLPSLGDVYRAKQLLDQLKVPTNEIRGIGLSMARLEPLGGSARVDTPAAGGEAAIPGDIHRFLKPQQQHGVVHLPPPTKGGVPAGNGGNVDSAQNGITPSKLNMAGSGGGVDTLPDEHNNAGETPGRLGRCSVSPR
eukprot:scaffold38532_cov29-Prasinocladus_malaysianus.AAC.2